MKMERDDFCSSFGSTSTTHPYAHPAFTTHEPIFDDALRPLPSEYDPSCFNWFTQDFPSLPLQPHLDSSLYSSSLLPTRIPDILPNSTHFLDLYSLEQPQRQLRLLPHSSPSSPTGQLKRTRLDLNISDSNNNSQTLSSIFHSFNSPPPIIPHSELARKRRQKLSEKTRCLQKLMPWDKKMDTGTMLQEAYKYIRFLQAQISILQSMPITSSLVTDDHINAPFGFNYAGLGRLNRQQLLQVLVNSPVAQTMLYSQDFCVFAYEQLVSLKKAERKNGSSTASLWNIIEKESISKYCLSCAVLKSLGACSSNPNPLPTSGVTVDDQFICLLRRQKKSKGKRFAYVEKQNSPARKAIGTPPHATTGGDTSYVSSHLPNSAQI